jgi:hypothetical protein
MKQKAMVRGAAGVPTHPLPGSAPDVDHTARVLVNAVSATTLLDQGGLEHGRQGKHHLQQLHQVLPKFDFTQCMISSATVNNASKYGILDSVKHTPYEFNYF